MPVAEHSIELNVPIGTAYNQWTQFETFPRFMSGVEEIQQLDNTHLHWRATVGGQQKEWDAVITEQVPDMRIAWKSTSGAKHAGVVTFHRLDEGHCRVMLQMEYEPEGLAENVGTMLGGLSRQVESDLQSFREFVEGRGTETGAWRGEVRREHAVEDGGVVREPVAGEPYRSPVDPATGVEGHPGTSAPREFE